MLTDTRSGSAERLLAALLPQTWGDRPALLAAARDVDDAHDDGLEALLSAWQVFRSCGELPAAGPLRDLVAALAQVLGSVGPELRLRPRRAV